MFWLPASWGANKNIVSDVDSVNKTETIKIDDEFINHWQG